MANNNYSSHWWWSAIVSDKSPPTVTRKRHEQSTTTGNIVGQTRLVCPNTRKIWVMFRGLQRGQLPKKFVHPGILDTLQPATNIPLGILQSPLHMNRKDKHPLRCCQWTKEDYIIDSMTKQIIKSCYHILPLVANTFVANMTGDKHSVTHMSTYTSHKTLHRPHQAVVTGCITAGFTLPHRWLRFFNAAVAYQLNSWVEFMHSKLVANA